MKRILLLLSPIAAACSSAPLGEMSSITPERCADALDLLTKLSSGESATFRFDDDGHAKIITSDWNYFSADAQQHIANTLAYHAACKNDTTPNSEQVEIRDFETNRVIVEGFPGALKEL